MRAMRAFKPRYDHVSPLGNFLFLQSKYNTIEIGGGRKSKSKSENNTFWGQRVTDGRTHNLALYMRIVISETEDVIRCFHESKGQQKWSHVVDIKLFYSRWLTRESQNLILIILKTFYQTTIGDNWSRNKIEDFTFFYSIKYPLLDAGNQFLTFLCNLDYRQWVKTTDHLSQSLTKYRNN